MDGSNSKRKKVGFAALFLDIFRNEPYLKGPSIHTAEIPEKETVWNKSTLEMRNDV